MLVDILVDLGDTNKIGQETHQRISTRFLENPKKGETASRFQVLKTMAFFPANFLAKRYGDEAYGILL